MMQNNRRLSKPSRASYLPSSQRYPFILRGCALVSLTLVVYLHYQFAHSIVYYASDTASNIASNSVTDFQSLDAYPDNMPTAQSTIQEWERQSENVMVGLYRYSSIATIQLPTADLEVPKFAPKQTRVGKVLQNVDASNNNDVVLLTRRGYKFNPEDNKRTPNQDRVLVLSRRNISIQGNSKVNSEWWIGLFDGHGYYGHDVSQFVSSEFARRINREWEDDNSPLSSEAASSAVKDVLKAIYLEINRSIPGFMRNSGSTGISVLKRGNLLYISNLGDSVGFVASYDKSHDSAEIIHATIPHKPDSPSERKRIEEKGGRVMDPPIPGYSARLAIPVTVGAQTIETGLAMSRSFGDHDGERFGLSAEPDIDVLDLSQFNKDKEYFVVTATDGLVDSRLLSEEEVALAMTRAMSCEEDESQIRRRVASDAGTKAARELILKSSEKWFTEPGKYRDDISIVVHKIRV